MSCDLCRRLSRAPDSRSPGPGSTGRTQLATQLCSIVVQEISNSYALLDLLYSCSPGGSRRRRAGGRGAANVNDEISFRTYNFGSVMYTYSLYSLRRCTVQLSSCIGTRPGGRLGLLRNDPVVRWPPRWPVRLDHTDVCTTG